MAFFMCATRTRSSVSTFAVDARTGVRAFLLLAALTVMAAAPAAQTANPRAILNQAMDDFIAGRVAESLAGFDRVAQLSPQSAPELWQRGIALYYLGRYKECRRQFESHLTVNPADVENAAWHYLCVARDEGPAKARAALLPVGRDNRAPMREVYQMFRGDISVESVLVAAGTDPLAKFYAALYVGLYHEANNNERASFYIADAADDRYASVGGYMHAVARVHMQVRKWTPPARTPAKPAPK
jgi:tetratricopeptide (TPR) repeat protein